MMVMLVVGMLNKYGQIAHGQKKKMHDLYR